jgi:hypothetical protein
MHGLILWKEKQVMGRSCNIKKTIGLILKFIFIQIWKIHRHFRYDFEHSLSGSSFVSNVPSTVIVANIVKHY